MRVLLHVPHRTPGCTPPLTHYTLHIALACTMNGKAQCNLGSMYAAGEAAALDPVEACRLYRLAAAQGHAEAQFSLGCMYANGTGVDQNYSTASRIFVSARELGYSEATNALHSLFPLLFPAGVAVQVVGLTKAAQLNGQQGVIWMSAAAAGRLPVLLSGAEKPIAIRGENLILKLAKV